MATIACPGCHAALQVPEAMGGKNVRCPKCKQPFAVPAAKPPVAAPVAKPVLRPAPPVPDEEVAFEPVRKSVTVPRSKRPIEDDDDERPAPRKRSIKKDEKTFPWLLVGGIGGGAAAILVVVLAVVFSMGGNAPNPPKGPAVLAQAAPAKGNPAPLKGVNPVEAAPAADGPLPAAMGENEIRLVKKATVRLKVKSDNGDAGEGSGFCALEKGLIVTNAHVLGMLHRKAMPRELLVFFNSGEPDERKVNGIVMGVDQDNDLALVRVDGETPTPLRLETASRLIELQKVYIFGFPFGSQLGSKGGTSVTASESSISSFRKNNDGSLHQIQVNGGMHPGNSGGPVVDSRGRVVGVSVAVIKGTLINFAVPAEKVQGLLTGRVRETTFGEPYGTAGAIRMPVTIACLDPGKRIRGMRLDVWTGPDGPARPGGPKTAGGQPGDTASKSYPMTYAANTGKADIQVPAVAGGDVVWIQPLLSQANGESFWGNAVAVPKSNAEPLERAPTQIAIKFPQSPDRTVHLTSKNTLQLHGGGKKLELGQTLVAEGLERTSPNPRGGAYDIRLSLGRLEMKRNIEQQGEAVPPAAIDIAKRFTYSFLATNEGRLLERGNPNWNPQIPLNLRLDANDIANSMLNSYEATSLGLPTRKVQPMETWDATIPLLIGGGKIRQVADLTLVCTYEGLRTHEGRKCAFIRLTGDVRPRNAEGAAKGTVTGTSLVDLENGFLTQMAISVRSDFEQGDLFAVATIDSEVKREPGNRLGIQPAPVQPPPKTGPKQPPVVAGAGKVILQKMGELLENDPVYGNTNRQHVVFPVSFEAGKTYVIDLIQQPGSFDPYLGLEDPNGQLVGQDDDSGGNLNSRMVFRSNITAEFRVVVTCFMRINQSGPYELRVTEVELKGPLKK